MGRTAPLTSKRCILYIYSTNTGTEYFKHDLYSPFFSLENAVCFIMLTCLVPSLLTFYIQDVLKLKKNNSGAKGLTMSLKLTIQASSLLDLTAFLEWNAETVISPLNVLNTENREELQNCINCHTALSS